jgi:energy-converting hydrogenase Eha subunit C
MFSYILERLGEASTIRGIIMFFGGLGLTIEPEMMNQIIAITIAGSGIIGMVFKDTPKGE